MSLTCGFLVCHEIPTPENIAHVKIEQVTLRVNATDQLFEIFRRVRDEYPDVPPRIPSFYKPKDPTRISKDTARERLKKKPLTELADQLDEETTIRDAYNVDPDVTVGSRYRLYICLESNSIAQTRNETHGEAEDTVGPLEKEFDQYVNAVRSGPTPSNAAKSSGYNTAQASPMALLDGRFNSDVNAPATTALPVEFYHEAFANFVSDASNTNLQLSGEILRDTAKLIRTLSHIRTREDSRSTEFRRLFAKIIEVAFEPVLNSDKSSADFWSQQDTPMHISAAPIIVEIKSELGQGGSDPSVQVSFSYARLYCQPERTEIRDISCCPSFLVGLAGSSLIVLGAVMTTRTIVQRLSAYEWFGASRILDNEQVVRLARLLLALRRGVATLKEYYSKLQQPIIHPGHLSPRFFPHINSAGPINFSYVKPLENHHTCVTFQAKQLATAEEADKLVVVKFVKTYCAGAHTLLADKGLAPKLIHDGTSGQRYAGFTVIIMDFVKGKTLHDLYSVSGMPPDVHSEVERGLDILNEAGYILGDLRRPNIMLADGDGSVRERLRFIDFDWACKEGDGTRYPCHLSEAIKASGVEDYDLITRECQDEMLKRL